MRIINLIAKILLILFLINIVSILLSNQTFAATYNQVYIKPIEANNNGIDAFPKSYQILLKKLNRPNWKFEAFYTDIDWNELIKQENLCMKNTICKSETDYFPNSWYCTCNQEGDENYYCASDEITNYYLDPRNFLTEVTIFQFLDLSNKVEISIEDIETAVSGTFLDGSSDGIRYSKMIYDASNASGENAYSIIAKIFQEQGRNLKGDIPEMVSGKNATYPNTYNFFNYGAKDGKDNQLSGLKYANDAGWNTPYKAMVEGAKLISNSYLKNGQTTKYTFKFDVVGNSTNDLYIKQYMTNIQDPTTQSEMLYNTYAQNGWIDNELTFIIPIYKNMPAYVKLPNTETEPLYYVSSNWSSVYLRTGPGGVGSEYSNITSLRKDTVVTMLQQGINGWAKISCNGQIGYMSENYLSKVNLEKDNYKVPTNTELPFVDVWTDDWYYNAVKYTYENGIIKGATDAEFRPSAKLTRGMLVTILWRMEKEPEPTSNNNFPDVKSGQYYYKAITWASKNKIISGYNSGNFGPNDNITREQLAVILRKYAKYKGKDVSAKASLSSYKDGSKVSSYAKESMQWAIKEKVMSGKDNATRLDPQGTASRAEAAGMISNYCINIK